MIDMGITKDSTCNYCGEHKKGYEKREDKEISKFRVINSFCSFCIHVRTSLIFWPNNLGDIRITLLDCCLKVILCLVERNLTLQVIVE